MENKGGGRERKDGAREGGRVPPLLRPRGRWFNNEKKARVVFSP